MNSNRFPSSSSINFKMLIIGAPDVGKTAMINKFTTGQIIQGQSHTNIQVYNRNIVIEKDSVYFEIWDMPGRLYPEWLLNNDLDKVRGIMLCIDVTDANSIKYVEKWQKVLAESFPEIKVLLVGTKCDVGDRKFSY